VIGEVFFGQMFGFLEHSTDHGDFIASLDALMPVIVIAAVAPTYVRPLVQASAIVIPGALKAVEALDGIARSAKAAASRRMQDAERGIEHRNDLLQQLFDIVREKGEKVNFGPDEATQESYAAMQVALCC